MDKHLWAASGAALVGMLGGRARADEARPMSLQLGGYVAGFVPSDDHELYDFRHATQVPMGSVAPGFGVRAALFPWSFLGIEVDGAVLRASLEGRDSVSVIGVGAHVIGQRPGKVRPFGLVGVGVMGVRSNDDVLGNDADAIGYVGVGIALDLATRLAVRADGRVVRAPAARIDGGTDHFSFSLGVSGVFDVRGTQRGVRRKQPALPPGPDPDGDGILGESDSCPEKPETVNQWQDEDGCPDEVPDTDSDGIDDVADRCPEKAEDFDRFADDDGCPDTDNDGDGTLDAFDRCPIAAGPIENAGCPDADRDTDAVVDRVDNCPDEAGTPEHHGCKDKQLVSITPTRLELVEHVAFQPTTAKLLPRSHKLLDQIAKLVVAHPELGKLVIEGHTDDRGDDAYNLELSQQRADAVQEYLIKSGVDARRLKVRGFGKTAPLDPTSTDKARALNRRVEFKIFR